MKQNFKAFVFLILMMLVIGCGSSGGDDEAPEPVDSQKPEMSITKPTEGATVSQGSDLQLTGTFTDDMELESLTVSLSFIDTKSHTGINDPWEPNNSPEIIALTGVKDELNNHQLFGESIPADCKGGNYVLMLDLKDKSGKTTSKQINIVIGG